MNEALSSVGTRRAPSIWYWIGCFSQYLRPYAAPFEKQVGNKKGYYPSKEEIIPAQLNPLRPTRLDGHGTSHPAVAYRRPTADDGPAVTALIARCPPLDPNSAYCNLLQCTHFAGSCIIAEADGVIVGWISGYRPPAQPDRFFVWQVAVDGSQRGNGLAGRMIDELIARPESRGVTHVITTVTEDNAASRSMFANWARRREANLAQTELFERERHFAGKHDTEWQLEIGPF